MLTPPVSTVLDRLYADAAVTTAKLRQMFSSLTPEERRARMADANADYRAFFHRAKDIHMPVSRHTGQLLYMLARATQAKGIVEFGTSFGLSTVHLAAALRDNGGGRLVGSEFEPGKLAAARANLAEAGLAGLCDIRDGDAVETLASDLPPTVEVLLLDGHKPLYPKVLELVAPKLRAGSCIVADNADASPQYLAVVRAAGSGYLSMPFSEDVELTVKL
ncbi:MAG: class I SAM-dependent methyltransferase [Myxococcaceae bacterium]